MARYGSEAIIMALLMIGGWMVVI